MSRQPDPIRAAYAKQLGKRLRRCREEGTDLSPKEMADLLGLKEETWKAYEKGSNLCPAHVLVEFVRRTGYGPWYVLTGEPDSNAPNKAPRAEVISASGRLSA